VELRIWSGAHVHVCRACVLRSSAHVCMCSACVLRSSAHVRRYIYGTQYSCSCYLALFRNFTKQFITLMKFQKILVFLCGSKMVRILGAFD
jgi:hypothetical protein